MAQVLTERQVQDALDAGGLEGWSVSGGKLRCEMEFGSFNEAFGFMTRAAMEIEKLNHHPEWLNVYNRLSISLVTHDAGGITENDLNLARTLSSLRQKPR